jgi:KTSC domain
MYLSFQYAAYDRKKRILEVCLNHGTRHQYRNVPRTTAVALVRAAEPAKYWKENIERQYRSAQVRVRHYTEREILMEMARAMLEFVGIPRTVNTSW